MLALTLGEKGNLSLRQTAVVGRSYDSVENVHFDDLIIHIYSCISMGNSWNTVRFT